MYPLEKRACVCLACKGENGCSNVVFYELSISDSHKTEETWQGCVQSSKPIKRARATEAGLVFVVNSSIAVGEILYIKVIVKDISGGQFSKLETFVMRPLMVIEDRNCTGQWYTKSVPWKRKSWIKFSDLRLQNSLHNWHWLNPWGFFTDCEVTPNYYKY